MNVYSKTKLLALTVAIIVPLGTALAEEEKAKPTPPIITLVEVQIKHGERMAWSEGVKAFKACYEEQGGEQHWWTWRRVGGKGTVYTVVLADANWAAFDEDDEKMQPCYPIMMEKMMPHEVSVSETFVRPNLDFSRPISGPVARVTGLMIDDYRAFMEVATVVNKTLKDENAGRPIEWLEPQIGAADDPDWYLVSRYENWAAMDVEVEGIWKVMERVHGEEKTAEMRAKVTAAIAGSDSYLYELSPGLSHLPARQ